MIYDLAVIGGGPAGYTAALEAAKYGLNVIVFEKDSVGGTCLNRGCVPTKYLRHVADICLMSENANAYGICFDGFNLYYHVAHEGVESTVRSLRNDLTALMERSNIAIIKGEASIVGDMTVVSNGNEYAAKDILIATGSVPKKIFDKKFFDSDDVLKMTELPENVKIIGGGVVAVEFAFILSDLGCNVTLAIRGERILRSFDKDIAARVAMSMKKKGITVLTKQSAEELSASENYDFVLEAVGRKAFVDGCGVNYATTNSILLDDTGAIIVDKNMRTSCEHIYAAGDVISNSSLLAHTAMEQGRIAVNAILEKESRAYSVINCIYADMEVASVGITEAKAKEMGISVVSAKQSLYGNARARISNSENGLIKLVADKETGKLLGACLYMENATDMISEFALAINNSLTVRELVMTRPHPTFEETFSDVVGSLLEKLS